MQNHWPFDDAPNTASLTTLFVLDGSPILDVYHDFEGGWQFHGEQFATAADARVVSLSSMLTLDATIAELCDLPYGWKAVRDRVASPWRRVKNHPFPTFAENGYYLEDAVWMAQYRDDVRPPPAETRENLEIGMHAKLLFRFRGERTDRQDGDTERMWVLVTEMNDGYYAGTLANDPTADVELAWGDEIYFHPLHVIDVVSDAEE